MILEEVFTRTGFSPEVVQLATQAFAGPAQAREDDADGRSRRLTWSTAAVTRAAAAEFSLDFSNIISDTGDSEHH